jgi:hypothetical protein
VDYAEVLIRTPRVVASPRDYGHIIPSRFKRGPFGNVNAFRLFGGGRRLSRCQRRRKQTAGNRERQYQE